MVKTLLIILVGGFFLIGGIYLVQEYKIPQLIPEDYDCENHPGFIFKSNPAPFESGQHYVNRHAKAIKNQIEEVCD